MRCAKCKTRNARGSRFCKRCGSLLIKRRKWPPAIALALVALLACAVGAGVYMFSFDLKPGTYELYNKSYTSNDPEVSLAVDDDSHATLFLRGNEIAGELERANFFELDEVTYRLGGLVYDPADYNFRENDRVQEVLLMVPRCINSGSIEGEWRLMVKALIDGQESCITLGGQLMGDGSARGGFATANLFDRSVDVASAYVNHGTWKKAGKSAWRVVGATKKRGWRIVVSQ